MPGLLPFRHSAEMLNRAQRGPLAADLGICNGYRHNLGRGVIHMRILILGATALVLSAGTSLAADPVTYEPIPQPVAERYAASGSVAIWGQYVYGNGYEVNEFFGGDTDSFTCDDDGFDNFCGGVWGLGADARIHLPVGASGFSVQFETLADWHSAFDDDDADDDEHARYLAAGAHLIYRTGAYAIGGFGGVSDSDHISETESSTSRHAFGGVEAAAFIGESATVFGQVGYAGAFGGEDFVDDLVFGRLGARYFFTENDRLEGWAGYGSTNHAEEGDNSELDWLQLAVNYERQLSSLPVSAFIGYQGDHVKVTERTFSQANEQAWAHTFKLGARWSFGGSLRQEDREGSRTFDMMNLRAPLSYTDDLEPFAFVFLP